MNEQTMIWRTARAAGTIDYEIPKKLEDPDKKLGLNIFPILQS